MQEKIFIPPHPLKTAVLLIVFNRLDITKQVFQAIRKAKPQRLYIAADGARENKRDDGEKIKEVREYITTHIDWDCKVSTLFRDKNLGCKYAPNSAIDWFFENEEMGIILEDDCLPSRSFFWFCENLLERYKNDTRIAIVSGNNFQFGIKKGNADYYFSMFPHTWGWATWRRAWKYQDVNMSAYPEFKNGNYMDKLFVRRGSKQYWLNKFDKTYKGELTNVWDYQWTFTCWSQNMLSIVPNINLVSNIGFNDEGTHTTVPNATVANMKSFEMNFPLMHPKIIMSECTADELEERTIFKQPVFIRRKLLKIFYRLPEKLQVKIKRVLA